VEDCNFSLCILLQCVLPTQPSRAIFASCKRIESISQVGLLFFVDAESWDASFLLVLALMISPSASGDLSAHLPFFDDAS